MAAATRPHPVRGQRPLIFLLLLAGALAAMPAVAIADDEEETEEGGAPTPSIPGTEGAPAAKPSEEADDIAARQAAAALLNEGNQLLDRKQYKDALGKYEAAYARFASPKILFNIAEAHRLLGHLAAAVDNYQRFLDGTKPPADSKIHQAVTARLVELRGQLGTIEVTSAVSGAEVTVDGKVAGTVPLSPVSVDPGKHTVAAQMQGYSRFEQSVQVGRGQKVQVDAKLQPLAATPPPVAQAAPETPAASSDEEEEEEEEETVAAVEQVADPELRKPTTAVVEADAGESKPITSRWWFWAVIGAVVVGGVAAGVGASSGGDDFVPSGELGGVSSTAEWRRF